jgi:hypothetical protein
MKTFTNKSRRSQFTDLEILVEDEFRTVIGSTVNWANLAFVEKVLL